MLTDFQAPVVSPHGIRTGLDACRAALRVHMNHVLTAISGASARPITFIRVRKSLRKGTVSATAWPAGSRNDGARRVTIQPEFNTATIQMGAIGLLLAILVLVLFWQAGQHSRATAIETARQTCQRQGAQFLDGTAALQTMRPFFNFREGPGLRRTYTFDYSVDGFGRHTGCVILRNTQVTAVLLDG
jgi:hypothetical protein